MNKEELAWALSAEPDNHLGYSKHEASSSDNSRNGFTSKTLHTEDGQFALNAPRDRLGSFQPQFVNFAVLRLIRACVGDWAMGTLLPG